MNILDIKKIIQNGNASEALEKLDNILSFSPRHHEALYLKSLILDKMGRFEEAFSVIKYLMKENFSDNEIQEYKNIRKKLREERHELYQTKLFDEGRQYFIHTDNQMGVSLIGIVGCAIFFFFMQQISLTNFPIVWMFGAFFVLVLLPFLYLLSLYFFSVANVVTNKDYLCVYYRFKKVKVEWKNVTGLVIYYSPNIHKDKLLLKIYTHQNKKEALTIDISEKNSPIKARKHFVRSVINYSDVPVSYIPVQETES